MAADLDSVATQSSMREIGVKLAEASFKLTDLAGAFDTLPGK